MIDNFFTSGWLFNESERDLESRYQMVNIGLLLSSISLIYGMLGNIIRDVSGLIMLEFFLLCVNLILFFILRKYRESFENVSLVITAQFTFLFLFLVYISEPIALKHIWLFTYPIILLYFQNTRNAIYWLIFTLIILLIAPVQAFVEVQYSLFQVTYISFVLIVVSVIIYFYQVKMDAAKDLILEQQDMLRKFNVELADQLKELKLQDQLLTAQSKQAVMGEMISMIAHQWRQPLSTITLQISNLHIKKALGKEVGEEEVDKTLSEISDTILYLSDTVDDFQTYFHPHKEISRIEVHELIQRAINFTLPRVNEKGIEIVLQKSDKAIISTYINEIIQVLLNILNNAIDALNEANKENPKIIISLQNNQKSIVVKIKDNADGIKDENISHLFEPYFSTKCKNGTGLGLYMSQMIMQKQFGTMIEVKTSSNGSTFIIEIPRSVS
jgi:signal transduction histidine kinase